MHTKLKAALLITIIFIIHFILQAASVVYSFLLTMERFDNRDAFISSNTFKYRASSIAADILTSPIILLIDNTFLQKLFQEGRGLFAFILNSLLWSLAIFFLIGFLQRRREQKRRKNQPKHF